MSVSRSYMKMRPSRIVVLASMSARSSSSDILLARLCPKCGKQVDISGRSYEEMRYSVRGCTEHETDVELEVMRNYSMWPHDWFGHVYKKYGVWVNGFVSVFM